MARWLHCCSTVPVFALQAPSGQTTFVPVDQLPPGDQLPSAPLLVAAYAFVWVAVLVLRLAALAAPEQGRRRDAHAAAASGAEGQLAVTAGHFIFIPSVLLVGIIIGWWLGSRAAHDAYAMELRRREEREGKR